MPNGHAMTIDAVILQLDPLKIVLLKNNFNPYRVKQVFKNCNFTNTASDARQSFAHLSILFEIFTILLGSDIPCQNLKTYSIC